MTGAVCKVRKAEGNGVDMMEWINVFGAVFIVVIMVPNIVYAVKCRDGFENKYRKKSVEIAEQIGRYGCGSAVICACTYIDFL